jgi:RNA polymerase sigma-70 factor (ECF subfamily)
MTDSPLQRAPSTDFPTTHWSWVLAAGDRDAPEARTALSGLCAAYWYPIYAFIRRRDRNPEAAADLTQGFFTLLIERRILAVADPARGRFRGFLMTACSNFLTSRYRYQHARRRGGTRRIFPLDAQGAEDRYRAEPPDTSAMTPEQLYERAWAVALLGRVLDRLRRKYEAADKSELFQRLMPTLAGDPDALPAAAIATALGTTEGAVHTAAHRLRRNYRELVHEEVAAVCDPAEVDDEINALFSALAQPGRPRAAETSVRARAPERSPQTPPRHG